ncbi:hypothetical protein A2962_04930 [Candidatus Woesebacteria bacterium RIFCSPLOWO2_01_FULL_39_61]|uniref:Serine aminopeptidase S33 domain-containing protein n=1 Tax=Candidatus Woesebacteria bacterium RIFCSPHIGHO2_02_FULL_39_13 TaxID=1802505 RepID=A0A1F7YZ57_9BACT|nr:MAG: hypothetical protein A2692_03180 [Candidatus Woesebacteria bacterium RIFCSPHIGHO2_01_FULL_39_95]OGM32612.1 MAG: hypothetical protein A3D01_05155 [Candidatus Woesebacteria bacterium RIFCSPHIGHO2_02_FULL_39_13]OGM36409.1 MAG: hypothetical protein A3E13_00700 [Candidatus Woesebacteria bacterium RIFCSPHIGHO2_12_FULL_40_20]OGM66680.1 MAG: hypothetical protein A2962_04930 [Candidatus Woesebacteria bacterium RIFCSPLOWO2_01_FULL_39_61]OGM72967.1 MAG: hypothetical protein A3H19_01380 [Candidatus
MRKNIVLLHGWGAETKKLKPLKDELEKRGWSVLLPKLAGFENPPPDKVWGIKEYSEYVYSEARNAFKNENFFVFGHSFGGGIAIKLAYRKCKGLSGIILCASRGVSRGKLLKRLLFSALAKTGKVFLLVPVLAGSFRRLLYKAAREHDYEKTEGIMKDIFKKVISEDLKPQIKQISTPTLILWGKIDRVTPMGDARFINESIKNSKIVLFEDEGHRLPYNKPKVIAEETDLWFKNL